MPLAGTARAQDVLDVDALAELAVASLLESPRLVIPGRVEFPGAESVRNDFTQGVPGDDYEFSALYETPLITGERDGYDVLSAVDPTDPLPGTGLVVTAAGSVNRESDDRPGDLFVVGDYNQPYFLGQQPGDVVDDDFMRVYGLEIGSTVQLHGSPADYVTVPVVTEFETGTAVFHVAGDTPDMVAFVGELTFNTPLTDPGSTTSPLYQYVTPADAPSSIPAYGGTGFTQLGGAGATVITDAEVDADGNLLVTGATRESLDGASGEGTLFAAKYQADGELLWLTQFGSEAGTLDAAVDSAVGDGGYYVTGRYLGEGVIGQKDAFVTKLDLETGAVVEEALWGGPGTQFAGGIALDAAGSVYTTGIGRDIDSAIQSDQDPFVEKRGIDDLALEFRLTYGGDPVTGGSNKEPWGQPVFVQDPDGAAGEGVLYSSGWVIGDFDSPLDETGGDLGRDVWLSAVDSDGNLLWVEQWGSSSLDTEWAWSTAADDDGFIYVAGHTYGDMGGEGSYLGGGDGFLSKIDPNAADGERVLWTVHVGTDETDEVRDLEIVGDQIYLSGHTWGSIDGVTENAGLTDAFVVRMSLDGEILASAQYGTEGQERAFLAVGEETLYLAGFTEGSLTSPLGGFVDAYTLALDPISLQIRSVPIPEPATAAMLCGGLGLCMLRRRR